MDTNVRGRRPSRDPKHRPVVRNNRNRSIERLQREVKMVEVGPSSAPDTRMTSPRPRRRSQCMRPFDERGYCPLHPEVKMAIRGRRGWTIKLPVCPKCGDRVSGRADTESTATYHDSCDDCCSYFEQETGARRSLYRSSGLRRTSDRSREDHREQSTRQSIGRTGNRRSGGNDSVRSSRWSRRSSTYNGEVDCDGDRSIKSGRSFRTRLRMSKRNSGSVVEGGPFDKGGRCFKHPQVKLASKGLLGWKIHLHSCPLCKHSQSEDERSVFSGMTGGSSSNYSHRSVGNKSHSSAQRSMCSRGNVSFASGRSMGSNATASSWVSNQSKRRLRDESFLPLDKYGYCKYHPDVQLCEVTRRGNWRVLLDFCPSCAADSLAVGGPAKAKLSRGLDSDNSSFISGNSARSLGSRSRSALVSKMPYVDMDGRPGRYSGRVSCETGLPNGFGRVAYNKGDCFSGVFSEGTKVHGQVTSKKAKASRPTTRSSTPLPPRNRMQLRPMDNERNRSKSRSRNKERRHY